MTTNVIIDLTRILQSASLKDTPEQHVQYIVDKISDVIHVNVCSLYLKNSTGDMALVASHGLTTALPVVIPNGQGLVGRVVKSCRAVNIIKPEQHPDYFYVPQSREEQFHSFCGVPMVRLGEVIGVLVVQSKRERILAAEQEAFLSTLASHLSLIVANISIKSNGLPVMNQRYKGLAGSAGVAIAKIKLVKAEQLKDVKEKQGLGIAVETENWLTLHQQVINDLSQEKITVSKSMGDNIASVFDAYVMVLNDPAFSDRIQSIIQEGWSLVTAIKQTVKFFSEQFLAMDDPYLRARHEDIDHLGNKLYQAQLNFLNQTTQNESQQDTLEGPIILMGNQIGVSDILSLPTDQLVGIACHSGAALSHIAVFSNALGIPAVMGLGEINDLQEGDLVVLDGNNGEIIFNPSKSLIKAYNTLIHSKHSLDEKLSALVDLPAITQDGFEVQLMANSGLQADINPGLKSGASGIGLFRTEIPFMSRNSLPSEDEQILVYKQVIDAYKDKPVYIRTLDIGGDKPLSYLPIVNEENPALGWRGIRFTLDNRQILMTQLRAILRAAEGRKNVHVLLPMISTNAELDQCLELMTLVCNQLNVEGIEFVRPKMGVMVEVPAAISLLPFWKYKIDFISIGSNDLSQYLLALDRNNPLVGKLYNSLHPAVISEIQRIVTICKESNLPLSLCGELASDPVAVFLLMGMGVNKLSMSAAKLPLIKWMIRQVTKKDAEEFLQLALKIDDAKRIRSLGLQTLQRLNADVNAA